MKTQIEEGKGVSEMHAHEQERYALRYTSDGYVIKTGPTISSILPLLMSDYKLHIWDRKEQKIVWQNSISERYGDIGVSKAIRS